MLKLTLLQKLLWTLAGCAILVYGVMWSWPSPESNPPAFRAEFELTDHTGATRTQRDYAGRWMLVFFGFTNCPDICPTTLSEVASVIEGLNRPGFTGELLFQMLGCFFSGIQGLMELLLCFLRRDVSDFAV